MKSNFCNRRAGASAACFGAALALFGVAGMASFSLPALAAVKDSGGHSEGLDRGSSSKDFDDGRSSKDSDDGRSFADADRGHRDHDPGHDHDYDRDHDHDHDHDHDGKCFNPSCTAL